MSAERAVVDWDAKMCQDVPSYAKLQLHSRWRAMPRSAMPEQAQV